jgi:hypothetical protein
MSEWITSWDDPDTEQPDHPTKEEIQRDTFIDAISEPGTIDAIIEGLGIAWLHLDTTKGDDTLQTTIGQLLDTIDPLNDPF